PEGRVTFYFRPRSVRVAPNAHAPAELTVRASAPWSGQEARRTLTIKATAGTDLSAERYVTFVQKPRIPHGPVRFIGIAAAVAILAGATLAGALVRNAGDNKPNSQQSQAVPPGTSLTPTTAPPGPSSPAASSPSGKAPSAAVMPPGSVVLDPAQ